MAEASEDHGLYKLHFVEFDDQGAPFDPRLSEGARSKKDESSVQIDSAVDQLHEMLRSADDCVRLFVFVHGWRHNSKFDDDDHFRAFLSDIAAQSRAADTDACIDQTLSTNKRTQAMSGNSKREVRVVGIYIGWRGGSLRELPGLAPLSFWDRKDTAERVAQGSVRELFGRLSALARCKRRAEGAGFGKSDNPRTQISGQLRTYVIAHSFGASIAYRALSQSLISSFAADLDSDDGLGEDGELPSVSRFVDMLVLVNPAIERLASILFFGLPTNAPNTARASRARALNFVGFPSIKRRLWRFLRRSVIGRPGLPSPSDRR